MKAGHICGTMVKIFDLSVTL